MRPAATTTPSPAACPICCRTSAPNASSIGAPTPSKSSSTTRPSTRRHVNDIKHAFIERIGAECETYDIPFFLEFVGYDPKGGDEKGLEFAKQKPAIVTGSMEEFSKPQYKVDVLKVEVPINAEYVEGSPASIKDRRPTPAQKRWTSSAKPRTSPPSRSSISAPASATRSSSKSLHMASEVRHGLLRRPVRPRDMERRHAHLRQARRARHWKTGSPTRASKTSTPSTTR